MSAPETTQMKPTYEDLLAALDRAHALLEQLAWGPNVDISTPYNEIGVLIARAKGEME